MKVPYIGYAAVAATMLSISALSQAQVLNFTKAEYSLGVSSQAGPVNDSKTQIGTSILHSGSLSLASYSAVNDPVLGDSYGSSAGGVGWSVSTAGSVTTLAGNGGGIAECLYNGFDTYANGAGTINLYFDILAPAAALVDSEGTYNSDLFILSGGTWVGFYTGMSGPDNILMPVGSYKLSTGAGAGASGTDFYSAGVDVTIKAQAVPEPATSVALVVGIATLAKRRRR